MPQPTPRPEILALAPYPSAPPVGDAGAGDARAPIRLNQNECAALPSKRVIEAFTAAARDANRYPDPSCSALRAAIADAHGLDMARIVCGNGSGELLALLARSYAGRGDEILTAEHAYLYFTTAAHLAGASPVRAAAAGDLGVDVDAMLSAVTERTRMVCVDNPGNPTGAYRSAHDMHRLRRGLRDDILLVIDSAYAEYATADDYDAGARLVEAGENTVMLRTFSKIYGLAGARVGWAYCPAGVADALNRARLPNNLAGPSQAAAVAALTDTARVGNLRAENDALRVKFCADLTALGVRAYPSQGCYVLARFAGVEMASTVDAKLRNRGIHGRPMAAYELPDCIRFTIGAAEEMAAVTKALAEVIDES